MEPKTAYSFKKHKYQEKILDAASNQGSKPTITIFKPSSIGISEFIVPAYEDVLRNTLNSLEQE